MNAPPPLQRNQQTLDLEHLNLLAIFHFIVAGLAFVVLGFFGLQFAFMRFVLENPEIARQGGPPPEILGFIKVFFGIFGVVGILAVLGNLLSGFYLRGRRNRIFSLVVAGFDCLQIPFGTVLGVFTIVVLMRDSVRQLYEANDLGHR